MFINNLYKVYVTHIVNYVHTVSLHMLCELEVSWANGRAVGV